MKNDEYFKREDIMDGESFLDLFQTYADTLQGRSMEGTLVHPECFRYDDKRIALSESQWRVQDRILQYEVVRIGKNFIQGFEPFR